jgi:hypothetical protein
VGHSSVRLNGKGISALLAMCGSHHKISCKIMQNVRFLNYGDASQA